MDWLRLVVGGDGHVATSMEVELGMADMGSSVHLREDPDRFQAVDIADDCDIDEPVHRVRVRDNPQTTAVDTDVCDGDSVSARIPHDGSIDGDLHVRWAVRQDSLDRPNPVRQCGRTDF